jgi:hypothetical protein
MLGPARNHTRIDVRRMVSLGGRPSDVDLIRNLGKHHSLHVVTAFHL